MSYSGGSSHPEGALTSGNAGLSADEDALAALFEALKLCEIERVDISGG
jgi:hypothetical protein